jgi:conjugal transfer/entry exclusion protein
MLASAQVDNLLKMREILNTQQQMQAAQAQAQTENDAALKGRNRDMLRGANGDRVIGNSAKF